MSERAITSAPRVPPGARRDVGLLAWGLAQASGRVTGTRPPNLFLVLGRHRRLFRGWLRFAARLMPGGTLPRRETELVILRVAHVRGCTYELEHHRRLGARAGLGEADVDRVRNGPDAAGWTARERALFRATDDLLEERDLSDERWRDLRHHLDERGAIELVLLVGHYDMLATAIRTLRIPLDEPRKARARAR